MALASRTFIALGRALDVVLSPLDHERAGEWVDAVLAELRPLLGADAASALLLAGGSAEFHGGDVDPNAVAAYARYYHRCDEGFAVQRRRLRLEVWTTGAVWDARRLRASEYWNDYKVPYRLYDALGITADGARGPAAPTLFFYRDRPTRPFGAEEQLVAGVLLPAFRAAVRTLAVVGPSLGALAAALGAALDATSVGACAFDLRGRLLYRNNAAARLLASDPSGDRLRQAVERAARGLAGVARGASSCHPAADSTARDVEIGGRRYRITATCAHHDAFGPEPVVLVCVERPGGEIAASEPFVARFGLTKREADVTHLLAQGRSNAAIAAALSISEHTARHHTERVMVKLGVHSRAQVAPTLLGDARPRG